MPVAIFADVSNTVINCYFRNVFYVKKILDSKNLKTLNLIPFVKLWSNILYLNGKLHKKSLFYMLELFFVFRKKAVTNLFCNESRYFLRRCNTI